jgi:hypothetical protein
MGINALSQLGTKQILCLRNNYIPSIYFLFAPPRPIIFCLVADG